MRSSAAPAVTTFAPEGASRLIRALRRLDRVAGTGLSGILTLLVLVCALLPLLHIANDVPRGFEVRPVLAHANRVPVSEAGTRVAATGIDVDESYEDVAPPRLPTLTALSEPNPASPRRVDVRDGALAGRLDRPPRRPVLG